MNQAASMLGCNNDELLYLIEDGQLPVYIKNRGWKIDCVAGARDEKGRIQLFNAGRIAPGFLQLSQLSIQKITHDDPYGNLVFVWHEQRKEKDEELEKHDFAYFSDRNKEKPEIIVSDFIFMAEDIEKLKTATPPEVLYTSAEYTTPYINLMQAAISKHRLSGKNQGKAESLKSWFQEHYVGGKKVSGNLAEAMATIVRLPTSQAGAAKPKNLEPSSDSLSS